MPNHPALKRLYKNYPKLLRSSRKRCLAATLQASEILYERMFSNALPRFGIENRFYPIKSAASYSLLYLILRVTTELPIKNVVEFGAGQTTLLLDGLRDKSNLDVYTVEHDPDWVQRIQQRIKHQIIHAPLVEKEVFGYASQTYSFHSDDLPDKIDLLIIDGPDGRRRKSRWHCLDIIDQKLNDDFVIIFDDAARKGELETIEQAIRMLESQGRSLAISPTESTISQCLIACGKYSSAAYF